VAVIGGGTGGYMTALAVKRRFPEMRVTVVESSEIPIIGVGEATTTLMPPFLHGELGLDVALLWKNVRPTLKLGIRFEWGLPDPDYYFAFPFDAASVIDAAAYDGNLHAQSIVSLLMHERRAPVLRGPDGRVVSLLGKYKFAYHLDNAPFVAFLKEAARGAGIDHVDMTIDEAVIDDGGRGIRAVRGGEREVCHDLYVDASGFRSFLLEKTLGARFVSFGSSLFCDRAVVATVPQGGTIDPFTTAETMAAGWCWRIPVVGADHRGYVYSSSFLSEERAIAEMRAKNPGMGEPWSVTFRSGRHDEFWRGNVVAVGNAYGFVEPLESTALHMVIVEIAYLLAGLERMHGGIDLAPFRKYACDAVGAHWDYLRWFLALHYRFNRRLDTPFWRAARSDVDISGFDDLVARYRHEGAGPWMDGRRPVHGDPAFGFTGIATMLLGQHVASSRPPQPTMSRDEWSRQATKHRGVVGWALGQREGLEVLAESGDLLRDFATSSRSWCTGDRERIRVPGPEAPSSPLTTDVG
jgi:tryptophan 7-halogenase